MRSVVSDRCTTSPSICVPSLYSFAVFLFPNIGPTPPSRSRRASIRASLDSHKRRDPQEERGRLRAAPPVARRFAESATRQSRGTPPTSGSEPHHIPTARVLPLEIACASGVGQLATRESPASRPADER